MIFVDGYKYNGVWKDDYRIDGIGIFNLIIDNI